MTVPVENQMTLENIFEILTRLLSSASPETLGVSLTGKLRELSGARCVLLLSHQDDDETGATVYASPAEMADLFTAGELRLFCPLRQTTSLPGKTCDLPGNHPLRATLERAGVVALHQSPLAAAGEHVGSVVLLDPPQSVAADAVIALLDRLLPLTALALRNLLCTARIIEQSLVLAEDAERQEIAVQQGAVEVSDYRSRFEAIFANAPIPLCFFGSDGTILEVNRRFVETFGYSHAEVPNLDAWWPRAYPDPVYRDWVMTTWGEAVQLAAKAGTDIEPIEYKVTCKDGAVRTVQISGSILGEHFLATFFDVTTRQRAQESLRQSEARFRMVAEHAREWIWEVDVNGLYTYASAAVEPILGYRPEEIVGRKYFYDFFLPEEREFLKDAAFDKFLSGESFNNFERRYLHRNGTEVWLSTCGTPFFDAVGLLAGYRGVDFDITERKLMDTERERLLMAIEQAGETVIITDPAGIVQYTNPAFETITGYGRSEVLGRHIRLLKSGTHDEAFYKEMWQTIDRNGVWRGHFVNRRKDGSLYDEEATISRLLDASGRIVGYVATKLDITARKQADTALLQKNIEMERFVYTVSHDLKSPLVTIKGFLGVLCEDLERGDTEMIAADMGFIREAADHMAHLLDELLELSRVGRVVNPPKQITFGAVVQDALAMVAGTLTVGLVEVVVGETDIILNADHRRLVELLQNLLENAAKYMGEQAEPQITVDAEYRSGDWVFCVRDNGIGVAPQYQEKIFGLFEKLDPASVGTGVGLALVRRIVELYEGRIWVESEGVGQGSCFCFTLPAALVEPLSVP